MQSRRIDVWLRLMNLLWNNQRQPERKPKIKWSEMRIQTRLRRTTEGGTYVVLNQVCIPHLSPRIYCLQAAKMFFLFNIWIQSCPRFCFAFLHRHVPFSVFFSLFQFSILLRFSFFEFSLLRFFEFDARGAVPMLEATKHHSVLQWTWYW